jgi:hypothetical protein
LISNDLYGLFGDEEESQKHHDKFHLLDKFEYQQEELLV